MLSVRIRQPLTITAATIGRFIAIAALIAVGLPALTAAPAAADDGDPFQCNDALYLINRDATVHRIDLTKSSNAADTTYVYTATASGASGNANQLGITGDGSVAISTRGDRIIVHNRATGITTSAASKASGSAATMGAVNPVNQLFYYGGVSGSTMSLYVFNPATSTTVGPVASVTLPSNPGANGDIAFDNRGRLYVVAASASSAALYRVDGEIPSTTPSKSFAAKRLSASSMSAAANGIAFGSDGYLYLGWGTALRKVNPINGAQVGSDITFGTSGFDSTDLASCASPRSVTVEVGMDDVKPGDEFTTTIDYNTPGVDNPSTTTGTGDDELTGLVVPGTTPGGEIDIVLTPGNPQTDLDDYDVTWQCVDDATKQVVDEGTGTTISYTAPTDGSGTVTCGFDVALVVGPTASNDSAGTPFNTSVTVDVLDNDVDGSTAIDPTTTVFTSAAASNSGRRLVVTGQGIWTIDPSTGEVTFTPESGFSGATTPVEYEVTDAKGLTDTATVTVTVRPGPNAANDTVATGPNTPVTVDVLDNDTPGQQADGSAGSWNTTSVVFTSVDATDGGKTLVVDGEGTYSIDPGGSVTFTPEETFSGPATPVTYAATDGFGNTASGSLIVRVGKAPQVVADTATTLQNSSVTVPVLANDTPGHLGIACTDYPTNTTPAGCDTGTWDATSVVFSSAGQPVGATVSDGGKKLTVPDQGVYTIGTDGVVTFTPVPTFTGTTTPVTYEATDSNGGAGSATFTVTVTEVKPTVNDDSAATMFNTPVTFSVTSNDIPGPAATIDAASTVFVATGQPTGATVSEGGKKLTVPGEGVWLLDDTGRVTFTPADDVTGPTSPVVYEVTDTNGSSATASVNVTVRPGPQSVDDTVPGTQGVPVTLDPLTNDTPGQNADGSHGEWDLDSLRFPEDGQPDGSTVSDGGKTITVPGEGVYAIDDDGTVTFEPEPTFRGPTTPVTYEGDDQAGNSTTGEISVVVAGVDPVVVDDAVKTPAGQPVSVDVLDNDSPGAPTAPLDPTSVVFTSPEATDGGKTLQTDDGVWTIDNDGVVSFDPAKGFEGETTVTYQVADSNGTTGSATVSVVVGTAPVAQPDTASTPQNTPVTVPVLDNDTPGDLGEACTDYPANSTPTGCDTGVWVTSSGVFSADGQPAGATVSVDGTTLSVPNEGVYTIDGAGEVTFTPTATFSGATKPVAYDVTDSLGNTATGTIHTTVRAITPTATDDSDSTPYGTPVTLPGVTNDDPGTDDGVTPALQPGSTVLTAAGAPAGSVLAADGTTLTTPHGEWTVATNGTITFTPADGYSGTTNATYRIVDANETTATAGLSVTVRSGPTAADDTVPTRQGVAVTVDPLGNDTPGQNVDGSAGEWDVDSLVFPADGQPAGATVSSDGKTITVPGEGVYTIDEDGEISFVPDPSFRGGTTPVAYEVTDNHGNTATGRLVGTVAGVDPVMKPDQAATEYGHRVVIDVLANDAAGAPHAPLDPTTLRLVDPSTGAGVTKVVVPGEGTWTVTSGKVEFVPAKGFSGKATPVGYTVTDANGTTGTSTVAVVVKSPPPTKPTDVVGKPGVPTTGDVLDGITPVPGGELLPGTVCLLPGSVTVDQKRLRRPAAVSDEACVKRHTEPGVGTWKVNKDGTVTFTAHNEFRGDASIDFQVSDTEGVVYQETYTTQIPMGLPNTGGPSLLLPLGGLVLLLLGGGFVLAGRRTRVE